MSALLRQATVADTDAILAIYGPFCERTFVSFEACAPQPDEMCARIRKITAQFPWLVCERDGNVIGYAYACPHRERAAYRWSVDVAVYVAEMAWRVGAGRALYTALLRLLVLQGYVKAYAGITLPNPGSVGLHEVLGFKSVGVYQGVGYKLGAWRDVGWWQLGLQPKPAAPREPMSVALIQQSPGWQDALDAGKSLLKF